MESIEPEQSPFAATSMQVSKFRRQYRAWLDKSAPYVAYRWIGTLGIFLFVIVRIIMTQKWYMVAYYLGIYLMNLFLAFIQPKFDPSDTTAEAEMEAGTSGGLPTTQDEEFQPFIRSLPEFKFWHSATIAIIIGLICTFVPIFDMPVFWPILLVYWLILFIIPMRKQIRHMIKYRYVPFSFGKINYNRHNS